jgi:hypothetical protein
MPKSPLAHLRQRRAGLLAALQGVNTPAQLAAVREELGQVDAQLEAFGEAGRQIIETTNEELKRS